MKKFMKQWMTLALAVMMLVTAVPMGNVEAKALVEEFKMAYPRRTALLDELQKVEKRL